MKHANVSELKAHLSSYLTAVRGGETVVVHDRKTPIARLIPYQQKVDGVEIQEPTLPVKDLKKIRGVRPRRSVDIVKLLRESRDQR
jgi:prevent-host-death family protein